jgi:hypothetical protein
MIRIFDVEIERCINVNRLRWPEPGQAMEDYGLNGNREYVDLRGLTWREVSEILAVEEELLRGYESIEGLPEDSNECDDDLEEDFSLLQIIDEGVAGTVAALSAARCIPCTSCNAGALGGWHHECYPIVAFYARPQHVPFLLQAAEVSDIGLSNGLDGGLIVYSGDIRRMPAFARELLALCKEFRQLRFRERRKTATKASADDLTEILPFNNIDLY